MGSFLVVCYVMVGICIYINDANDGINEYRGVCYERKRGNKEK